MAPTLNSEVNSEEDSHLMTLRVTLDQYPSVVVDKDFEVRVNKCKVLEFTTDPVTPTEHPTEWYFVFSPEKYFFYTNYTMSPSCDYSFTYDYSLSGHDFEVFPDQWWEFGERGVAAYTEIKLLHADYTVWTKFMLNDYNVTYIDSNLDSAFVVFPEQEWTLKVYDVCRDTEVTPSFDIMTLHTIIGNGGASYEFLNFNDTESLRVDQELDYANVGY